MKSKIERISAFIFFLFCSIQVGAQSNQIGFRFEIDGKVVKRNFVATIICKDQSVRLDAAPNSFLLPPEMPNCLTYTVKFDSKRDHLAFEPVFRKDLSADWILGIDNKPFELDNITAAESDLNIRQLLYLRVRPKDGSIATVLVIKCANSSKQKSGSGLRCCDL